MKIGQTYQLIDNLVNWLKEKLPIIKVKLEEENPEFIIPDYKDYIVGFVDIFKVKNYPSLMIGIGNRRQEETFSSSYTLDLVSINKAFDKETTVKEGYLLSDALTYLIKNNPHLDGSVLRFELDKVEYFQGDDFFISGISLILEVEEGEI